MQDWDRKKTKWLRENFLVVVLIQIVIIIIIVNIGFAVRCWLFPTPRKENV